MKEPMEENRPLKSLNWNSLTPLECRCGGRLERSESKIGYWKCSRCECYWWWNNYGEGLEFVQAPGDPEGHVNQELMEILSGVPNLYSMLADLAEHEVLGLRMHHVIGCPGERGTLLIAYQANGGGYYPGGVLKFVLRTGDHDDE